MVSEEGKTLGFCAAFLGEIFINLPIYYIWCYQFWTSSDPLLLWTLINPLCAFLQQFSLNEDLTNVIHASLFLLQYIHLRCQQPHRSPFPSSSWQWWPRSRSTAGQIHLVGRRGRGGECNWPFFQGNFFQRNSFNGNIFREIVSKNCCLRNSFRTEMPCDVDHLYTTTTGWINVIHMCQVLHR